MTTEFTIDLSSNRRCQVHVGRGASAKLPDLWRARWQTAAIIGDENVIQLFGERVVRSLEGLTSRVLVADFPSGEAHKTRRTKELLEDRLLDQEMDRHGCVVALGGGISLDLAGFVAATFLRGVEYVSVPTSLLAQVDASVGGKTGVNTDRGKNLVGTFWQPAAVLVDPELLPSLPAAEWCNGLAEMVKHAVIADEDLFCWLEQHAASMGVPSVVDDHPLRRCVEIKAEVVRQDEREAGLRAILNFGHTVGHALESASGHALSHGRAVALGMLLEGQLACDLCGFPHASLDRLGALLRDLGLDLWRPALDFEALLPYLGLDKKRQDGQLRMALPCDLGRMAGANQGYTVAVPLDRLRRVYEG